MRLLLLIFIVLLTIILTISNMQQVDLRFFSSDYETTMSVNILILICFFAGVFVGIISCLAYCGKKMRYGKIKLRQAELEKNALQQQITAINIEKNALLQI